MAMIIIIVLVIAIILFMIFMKEDILPDSEMLRAKEPLKSFKDQLQEECFSRLLNTETGKNIRKIYNYEEIYNQESLDITLEAFKEVFKKTKTGQNEIAYNNMKHYLVKYYTNKILEFGSKSHKVMLSKYILELKKEGKV